MRTLPHSRLVRRFVAAVAAIGTFALPLGNVAFSANTWNPTLLVNTQAHQTIEEGNGTSNIELRFGPTLNQKLYFDRTNARFTFTNSLRVNGNFYATGSLAVTRHMSGGSLHVMTSATVGGNLAATGTLKIGGATTLNGATTITGNTKVRGNLSGSTLTVDGLRSCDTIDTDANGNLVCGSDTSGGVTQTEADARFVNVSGDTMTGGLILNGANVGLTASGQLRAGGAIIASGALVIGGTGKTKGDFTLNSDNGAADAILTFGSDGTAETATFKNNEDRFEFSDDLNVTGGLYASGALIIGGAGSIKGDFTINSDSGAADTILTFGSDSTNETVTFKNNEDRFEFSDDIRATGGIYASGTLIIDGAATLKSTLGVTGNVTTNGDLTLNNDQGAADTILTFGSDSTNETVTFKNNEDRFEVSDDLRATGGLAASGTIVVDGAAVFKSTIKLNGVTYTFPATAAGTSGKVLKSDANGILSWSTDTDTNTGLSQVEADARFVNTSGDTLTGSLILNGANVGLTASGQLRAGGAVLASGALVIGGAGKVKGDFTLNSDNGAADAILTFGNNTLAQTLTFSHANQRFELSKDLKVTGGVRASGNISGSTLTVDGAVTLGSITYSTPTSQAANTYLKNDGAGGLTWATTSTANGSGALSLHPQYPNAVYTQSGTTAVGTLTQGADTTNNELFYRWTTEETGIQDYWTWVRVKVPKNFSNWNPNAIQFRYRTNTTSAAANYFTLRLLDTTGANVALTSNANLVSGVANTWTTATLGNVTSGTFAPEGYIVVLIKAASTSAGFADAGFLNFNWSTTTP